jgi:RimJ/RimL family protein N-acetyltransferase
MPDGFTLHVPSEEDWAAIRDIRLRMVTDTPEAFLETREQVLARDEQGWRARFREQSGPDSHRVVAVAPDGRWVGTVGCFLSEGSPPYIVAVRPGPRRANFVGVFVDPEWRGGTGVFDALLGDVVRWVRDEKGIAELHLHVVEGNERALRAYRKRGFRETGIIDRTHDGADAGEVEMVLALSPQAGSSTE